MKKNTTNNKQFKVNASSHIKEASMKVFLE